MRCRSCNIGENDLYGEPTFIYDGEVFWGDDRLEDCIKWVKSN